jgi:hypothetical protein
LGHVSHDETFSSLIPVLFPFPSCVFLGRKRLLHELWKFVDVDVCTKNGQKTMALDKHLVMNFTEEYGQE